ERYFGYDLGPSSHPRWVSGVERNPGSFPDLGPSSYLRWVSRTLSGAEGASNPMLVQIHGRKQLSTSPAIPISPKKKGTYLRCLSILFKIFLLALWLYFYRTTTFATS